MDEIDLFVPHQVNLRIMSVAARALGLPAERMFVTVDRYGNTSSATIPIALARAQDSGRLQAGDRVLLTTIDADLTWGAAVVGWAEQRTRPVAAEPSRELDTAR